MGTRSWRMAALAVLLIPISVAAPPDPPAYVGAATCGTCHTGAFTSWAGSDHSRAALVFGRAMGKEMMRQASARNLRFSCRGCHAPPDTTAPALFREGFRREDGVQCETCHGPGSLHVQRRIDGSTIATVQSTLPARADTTFCLTCHRAGKPLHDSRIMRTPPFNMSTFWRRIQHGR